MSKYFKKIISLVIAVSLCISLIPVSNIYNTANVAQAASATSGKCGDNAYWSLAATGETDDEGNPFYKLTIAGTGNMYDNFSSTIPWREHNKHITHIVINNGITSIGNYCFTSHIALRSVTIPDSITRIGKAAFSNCHSLPSVSLPGNLITIEEYAFNSCSLSNIAFPESLKTIGEAAFAYNSIKNVTIPKNVAEIGTTPFSWNNDLNSITVESGNIYYTVIDNVLYK